MKIAILGAGMVANFIRSKLVQAGNHATLGRVASNSAGPERLHPIAGKAARILSVVAVCILQVAVFTPVAHGQNTPSAKADTNAAPTLIRQMAGTWDVQQRMWPGSDAKPIQLPPAVAHRRLLGGAFLEEIMELAPGSKEAPFTRIACFNYNMVNQQYEYFSIDTRGPQMMNERSYETGVQSKAQDQGVLVLYGDSFVAPRWGEMTNAAFRYRLTIGEVQNDRHVVRLYLTPQSGESAKEFLAFEYIYTRRR
jgi:hypothetical protein